MFWKRFFIRAGYGLGVVLSASCLLALLLLTQSKQYIFEVSLLSPEETVEPFPVSVNMHDQVIIEQPGVSGFYTDTLASNPGYQENWWNKVAAVFASHTWYQNLASSVSRIIVIWPGERKEEIAKNIGDIMRWNQEDRQIFLNIIDSTYPILSEGKYYPGQYVAHRYATPAEIAALLTTQFENEVLARYTPTVADQVPLQTAIIIASLIEREANTFSNMREVSGVIWNRIFINMPLQLDATLQYIKGSKTNIKSWWPVVNPSDKFLDSPFNTYEHAGLPPAPIANPSVEAIVAALNPIITDCLYYFHTNNGNYHCSATYEGHVEKLRSIYGRGS